MKTKIVIAVLVIAVIVAAGMAFAQQGPRGGNEACPTPGMGMQAGPGAGGCGLGLCMGVGPEVMKDLNLTQDQVAQLQQLRDKCIADTANTRQQMQDAHAALRDLMLAQNPDKDAIKRQLATIDAIQAELRNSCIDCMFAAREILTPEQREKARTALMNAKGPMGMGMGCGMMGKGCGMGPGMGKGPGAGVGTCPMGGMGRNAGVCPNAPK